MSFRFPVITQEPISVRPMGIIRRTQRIVQNDVNGDLNIPIVVPSGKVWRIEGIVIHNTFSVAVPATVRTDVLYHTDAEDGTGNLISNIVLPVGVELTQLYALGVGYPYATYTYNRAGAADSRYTLLPLPDTLMRGNYEIDFDLYDYGANDDCVIYITYSEETE